MGRKWNKKKLRKPQRDQRKLDTTAKPVGADSLHPCFNISHLDSRFSLDRCQRAQKIALLGTLHQLAQCTWRELGISPREKLGFELFDNFPKPTPSSLLDQITEDKPVTCFRFGKKERMYGYRLHRAYLIVWIDPDHKLIKG